MPAKWPGKRKYLDGLLVSCPDLTGFVGLPVVPSCILSSCMSCPRPRISAPAGPISACCHSLSLFLRLVGMDMLGEVTFVLMRSSSLCHKGNWRAILHTYALRAPFTPRLVVLHVPTEKICPERVCIWLRFAAIRQVTHITAGGLHEHQTNIHPSDRLIQQWKQSIVPLFVVVSLYSVQYCTAVPTSGSPISAIKFWFMYSSTRLLIPFIPPHLPRFTRASRRPRYARSPKAR